MQAALAAGARGQVVQMHGEFNRDPSAGTGQQQFAFTLAAFLITASDTAFFGFSDGWCAGIPDAVCVGCIVSSSFLAASASLVLVLCVLLARGVLMTVLAALLLLLLLLHNDDDA